MISSLPTIPLTDETREALDAQGIEATPRMTEMEARALLSVRAQFEERSDTPPCFREKFDPDAALCRGCLILVHCWHGDAKYTKALLADTVSPPPGVPSEVVNTMLLAEKPTAVPPPEPAPEPAKTPTPPPPKKQKAAPPAPVTPVPEGKPTAAKTTPVCPRCGAKEGEPCRTPKGKPAKMHAARKKAAAPDQKVPTPKASAPPPPPPPPPPKKG